MNFDTRQQQLFNGKEFFIQKNYNAKFEDITEDGQFSGYATVYNVVDLDGDIVLPGCFDKSLEIKDKSEIKLLWQHNINEPIGMIQHIVEDDYGLYIRGKLLLDLPKAREAYSLIINEIINSFSIGFVINDFDHRGGYRRIKKADLWEVSIVTFPANIHAKITEIKSSENLKELENAIQQGLDVLGDFPHNNNS